MSARKSTPLPSFTFLNDVMFIDPTSPSGLRWRRCGPGKKRSLVAGNLHTAGPQNRWQVMVSKKNLRGARIIWLLAYGEDPGGLDIDHIDGDPSNNCVENLRLCTHAENMRNQGSRCGSSRFKGVSLIPSSGRWRATISFKGKSLHIGTFADEIEASRAYDEKATALFGEFARRNDAPPLNRTPTPTILDITNEPPH